MKRPNHLLNCLIDCCLLAVMAVITLQALHWLCD